MWMVKYIGLLDASKERSSFEMSSAESNAEIYPIPVPPCYFSLTFKSLKMKEHGPSKHREHVYSDTASRTVITWCKGTSPMTLQDLHND